jgi:virulence-associated protein VapD
MTGIQNDFRSSVPSRNYIFSECGSGLFVSSSQTKVTNLEVAVFVEQKVAWLEISVDDIRAVDVKTSSKQLVHEVLRVVVGQILARVDDSMHVGLHQVCDDVNVFVASGCRWFLNINESNDVLVIKEFYNELS